MNAARRLDGALIDTCKTLGRVRETQARARAGAIEALRRIEERLVVALEGGRLRGMPNLLPEAEQPFYAVRLRGRFDEVLPLDGRAVLVLRDDGRLCMAMREEQRTLRPETVTVHWEAHDGDLRAEDLEVVTERVHEALVSHLARISRTEARYRAAADLAQRLANALR